MQNITFWFLFRFRNYQWKSRWGELIGALSFRIAEKPSLIKMVVLVCWKINLKIAVKKKGAIISSPFITMKHSFCLSWQRSAVKKMQWMNKNSNTIPKDLFLQGFAHQADCFSPAPPKKPHPKYWGREKCDPPLKLLNLLLVPHQPFSFSGWNQWQIMSQ